jgi:hypothetical protein
MFFKIVIKIYEYAPAYAAIIRFKNILSSSTLSYNLELKNIIKCGEFLDVINDDQVHKYKISVKTNHLLYNYYLWATCFDSLESSSGPTKNRSKVI